MSDKIEFGEDFEGENLDVPEKKDGPKITKHRFDLDQTLKGIIRMSG